MRTNTVSYVVITPVRDEEEHIQSTIESMVRQTVLPKEWVIVDDGSKDGTGKIIDEYASRYPWITGRPPQRTAASERPAAVWWMRSMTDIGALTLPAIRDFIVKFDGDLTFEADYFEKCFVEFNRDPKLGVGGGSDLLCHRWQKEIRGSPRIPCQGRHQNLSEDCWDSIGGLLAAPGWDTMDEVKANSLGWSTRSFPHLHLIHQRDTGAVDGLWPTLVKYGRANYICGYHPLFMIAKAGVRLAKKPYLIGSIGLMYGFISGYVRRVPRVNDQAAIAYLRRQQICRLLGRETIWR